MVVFLSRQNDNKKKKKSKAMLTGRGLHRLERRKNKIGRILSSLVVFVSYSTMISTPELVRNSSLARD